MSLKNISKPDKEEYAFRVIDEVVYRLDGA